MNPRRAAPGNLRGGYYEKNAYIFITAIRRCGIGRQFHCATNRFGYAALVAALGFNFRKQKEVSNYGQ